jgi:hypothetical protein
MLKHLKPTGTNYTKPQNILQGEAMYKMLWTADKLISF